MMKLDFSNYYSHEANQQYMSVSQYKDFLECEARAMARLQEWQEPDNEAFLVGSYVHAWNEGPAAMEEFKLTHPDIYSSRGATKGELKAAYKVADQMIEVIKSDESCMKVLAGEKEVIFTAELFGALWKIKIDSYNPTGGYFADLKTVKSLHEKVWSELESRKVNFVEAYGYLTQMSVYSEVERLATGRGEWLEPLMVAVTKEDPPDKAIIKFGVDELKYELEKVEFYLPHIISVKSGQEQPKRCENCRYCRETKKIDKFIHWSEL